MCLFASLTLGELLEMKLQSSVKLKLSEINGLARETIKSLSSKYTFPEEITCLTLRLTQYKILLVKNSSKCLILALTLPLFQICQNENSLRRKRFTTSLLRKATALAWILKNKRRISVLRCCKGSLSFIPF